MKPIHITATTFILLIHFFASTVAKAQDHYFEIQATYTQAWVNLDRFYKYRIIIKPENPFKTPLSHEGLTWDDKRWMIMAIDGSSDEEIIYAAELDESFVEELRTLFSKPDSLIVYEPSQQGHSATSKLEYYSRLDDATTHFSLYSRGGAPPTALRKKDGVTYWDSQIIDFNPQRDKPQREIERIHTYIFELAKKHAKRLPLYDPTKAAVEDRKLWNRKPKSKFGTVDLVREIGFFDRRAEFEEIAELRFDKLSVDVETTDTLSLGNDLFLLVDNHQFFLRKKQQVIPLSFRQAIQGTVLISANRRYAVYAFEARWPGEWHLFHVDIETEEVVQVFERTYGALLFRDVALDNEGNVYLLLNGDIYKWEKS